jgi:hypothetical protein
MTEGGIKYNNCISSRVGRYVDNVENLCVSLIEIVNSADLGSSSKYKDEIVFGLRWRKVPEEEQFVQG